VVIVNFFLTFSKFPFVSDDPLCVFRLIQWNPAPALATTLAMPDDSLGSYNYSPSPSSRYSDRDAHRFKADEDHVWFEDQWMVASLCHE
jgi:hypothetical protein